MIQILQLVFYFIIIFLVLYLGLVLVNTVILIYTLPAEQLLPQAVQNTNIQIQKWLKGFDNLPEERNCYSDFYIELIHQATKLHPYLNTGSYPNGVQQEGLDFYLWLSKIPDPKALEDWKIQLRQTVRAYDDNLDVLFNMVEEEPFFEVKNKSGIKRIAKSIRTWAS
ncbi:hypothetical protein HMPREF9966_1474 [Streptococcus anginosus SK52 = DSM 20563]|uniref:hypothetical protein n=1 Tax=Streptococcus anginosus TaxID=1328 RepID=UPI00020DE781|nr:hypothetical protein [Streptococcus anginosus]EGL47713.1 hypothetical protein HMPREF9966_1474 [Streptococcus anginosus SK52 = DSM 20563]